MEPITDTQAVGVSPYGVERCQRGHLWIFSNDVVGKPPSMEPGTWCVFLAKGRPFGVGYFNPHSLIAGRLLSREPIGDRSDFLRGRLDAAFRRRWPLAENQGARLLFSESDFLPGLVIDVYADHMVAQSNTAGMDHVLNELEALLPEVYKKVFGRPLKGLVFRGDSPFRKWEGIDPFSRVVRGEEAALASVVFTEDDTDFEIDLLGGQKTGFFLDQRENRSRLAQWLHGKSDAAVLDLCCYVGGWGVRALKAGASSVTFVDESAAALRGALKNVERNGFDKARGRCVEKDVFDFLQHDDGRYDAIIMDPPAFAKTRKDIGRALRAYEKMARLAWRRLKKGGVLFASSCSHHVTEEPFSAALADAVGKEHGLARIVHTGSQAADHPVLLSMPETRYLKCVALERCDGM